MSKLENFVIILSLYAKGSYEKHQPINAIIQRSQLKPHFVVGAAKAKTVCRIMEPVTHVWRLSQYPNL